jgi:hypothetical protein
MPDQGITIRRQSRGLFQRNLPLSDTLIAFQWETRIEGGGSMVLMVLMAVFLVFSPIGSSIKQVIAWLIPIAIILMFAILCVIATYSDSVGPGWYLQLGGFYMGFLGSLIGAFTAKRPRRQRLLEGTAPKNLDDFA